MFARGKILLKLMLIAILAIQPVVFSYAMAGMHHSQHQNTTELTTAMSLHDNQHEKQHKDHHSALHNTVSPDQVMNHASSDDKHGGMLDNCCDTAACGVATIGYIHLVLPQFHFEYVLITHLPMTSADLTTEVRPPRLSIT